MRIAYMLNTLGIGGAEKQVIGLAERMSARGHAVTILVLMARAEEEWATSLDVVHLNLHKSPWSLVFSLWQAVLALRAFQVDVLHTHQFHGNLFGRALKLALPRMHVISTIHNVYEGGALRMAAYRITDLLSGRSVAVCSAAADQAVETRSVPRRKCAIIANGIDAGVLPVDTDRRRAKRSQMGVNGGFVWMSAARVVPAKDYENLLRAFAWVHQANACGELWIAGEGRGAYAKRMRALGVQLGLGDSVRWLGLRRDLAELLDAADGFVLSSAWEGMPLALGEAMAMEKPAVATDVGGVRELIGDCGTIVPPGNSAALAKGMLEIMHTSRAFQQRMGEVARRRIVESFSIEKNATSWEALYRSEMMLN